MSSVSRRACYKCGELGHHAEACASPQRLCYNCTFLPSTALLRFAARPLTLATGKQPNHESNECPMPRTTKAKQCYHCQGLGHVQAECPTLRLNGGAPGLSNRCYNCDGVGHVAVRFLPSAEVVVVRAMLTLSCSATAPTLWLPGASDQDRPSAAAQAVPSSAALVRPRATSAAGQTTLLATARRRR